MHAFVDESGQRSRSLTSSDHFIMSAAVIPEAHKIAATQQLDRLRRELRRSPGAELSWKDVRSHSDRLQIAMSVGSWDWLTTISVVANKRHLPPTTMSQNEVYLYQLRYLLERLSWCGRQHQELCSYTLAHIRGFRVAELREYEATLRADETQIDWEWLDPAGGTIDQPNRVALLQIADLVASATGAAFNADKFGHTEQRYLLEMGSRIWRYKPESPITSYGLKMHPWNDALRVAHPWIATL